VRRGKEREREIKREEEREREIQITLERGRVTEEGMTRRG